MKKEDNLKVLERLDKNTWVKQTVIGEKTEITKEIIKDLDRQIKEIKRR